MFLNGIQRQNFDFQILVIAKSLRTKNYDSLLPKKQFKFEAKKSENFFNAKNFDSIHQNIFVKVSRRKIFQKKFSDRKSD